MPWPKGKKLPPDHVAKLRGRVPWNKGKTRDDDLRIARPWLGMERDEATRQKLRESIRALKGDSIRYGAAHRRIHAGRGSPSHCEHCGMNDPDKRYEWAFTGEGHDSGSKPFSLEPYDYVRLCLPCHRAFDLEGVLNG